MYLIYFLILPSPTTTPTDNKKSLGNRKQSCHNPTFLFWLPKQLHYQVGKANGIILVTRDSWEHLNANPQVTQLVISPPFLLPFTHHQIFYVLPSLSKKPVLERVMNPFYCFAHTSSSTWNVSSALLSSSE